MVHSVEREGGGWTEERNNPFPLSGGLIPLLLKVTQNSV